MHQAEDCLKKQQLLRKDKAVDNTESYWKSKAKGHEHPHANQLRNLDDVIARKVNIVNAARDGAILELSQKIAEEHQVEKWKTKLTNEQKKWHECIYKLKDKMKKLQAESGEGINILNDEMLEERKPDIAESKSNIEQ